MEKASVGIVGAGIGGLTTALALEKRGFNCEIFEQAPEFRPVGAGIVLSPNAMAVLDRLGVGEDIRRRGNPLQRAVLVSRSGRCLSRVDLEAIRNEVGTTSVALPRSELHEALHTSLVRTRIHLGWRVADLSDGPEGMTLRGEKSESREFSLVVGADGIHSRVRECLWGESPLRPAGQFCWRALTTHPVSREAGLPAREAWEILGPGTRFGFVPVGRERVYWYATHRAREPLSPEFLRTTFSRWPDPVPALLASTEEDAIVSHFLFDRRPATGWHRGRVVLLGDAVHPTTPNMGQGAAMAIESAWVLARCLAEAGVTSAALLRYERERAPRTAAVTRQSWRMGKVLQPGSAALARLRDAALALAPPALAHRALVRFIRSGPRGD